MFNRNIAVLALAATVLLGTSACSITGNVPTLQMYTPSDGVDGDTSSVAFRNFIVLSNGTVSELIGSAINTTQKDVSFSLSYQGAAGSQTASYSLKAGQKLDFGYNGQSAIAVANAGKAGEVTVVGAAEGSDSIKLNVPILDGTLPQYTDLVNSLGTAQ